MKILDRNSAYLGVSTLQLMENAGKGVAEEVSRRFEPCRVVVFGGVGRNGGDGMVAARHLASRGFDVTFFLIGEEAHIKDESVLANWKTLNSMTWSIKVRIARDSSQLTPPECDVAIDAMLGTGAKGMLREPILTAVKAFNSLKCYKVAVDIPTGIDADTGDVLGEAVKADLTVTLHAPKVGLEAAKEHVGELRLAFIGIPPEAEIYAGPGDVEAVIKPRPYDAHKGLFGRLLVIGGSETYTGAPALVGLSALRVGVDLVYIAAPEKTAYTIASFSPNLITIKLAGGHLSPLNIAELKVYLDKVDAIAIGPGLGTKKETFQAVNELLNLFRTLKKPVLIDADALKALGPLEQPLGLPAVLTPHAGEFEIISKKRPSSKIAERIEDVRSLAKRAGCVVLLKGYIDVICEGDRYKLNLTGNPGMTVGGTGDTLSGIVGGLLAQGVDPFEGAVAGAFINGAAGDLAYEELGYHLTPMDLIKHIPKVMNEPMVHKKLKDKRPRLPVFNGSH